LPSWIAREHASREPSSDLFTVHPIAPIVALNKDESPIAGGYRWRTDRSACQDKPSFVA
jgi:hypothetical protein